MDTNAQIISDLQNKIGFDKPVDFISEWKGVPVVVTGQMQEIRENSIVFKVEAPDSICFTKHDKALILYDMFIMGLQGRIMAFDPRKGIAEFGEFIYIDRGYGYRSTVRVEPDSPIPGSLVVEDVAISCLVIDISLNGFGLSIESSTVLELYKGQSVHLVISVLDQEIEIPGTLLNITRKNDLIRLAMLSSPNAPDHAIINRYITQRRADIRQEIQDAYQQAIKNCI